MACALGLFPVVVGARDGVAQIRESGKDEGLFEGLIAVPRPMFVPD